jgi:checkpoint serine/threonine-protein kinase
MAGDSVIGSDLCLIDFGRGIDLAKDEERAVSLSDDNVMNKRFVGPSCVKEMMCVAMRRGLPWSFDADTFGICACVHVLLFSSHIELKEEKNGDWIPIEPLEGLTYATFWDEMFRTLLNLDPETKVAIGSRPHSLRQLRKKIDKEWRDDSVLQSELRRQAYLLPSTRDILKKGNRPISISS